MSTRQRQSPPPALVPLWQTGLFLLLSPALLVPAGRWVYAGAHAVHELRPIVPARLSGPDSLEEPAWTAPPTVSLRADSSIPALSRFRLLAPAAQSVLLGGSFNDFDAAQYPLVRGDDGVWEIAIPLPPGRYAYKFKVDGEWLLDPTNPDRTPSPKESSLWEVP